VSRDPCRRHLPRYDLYYLDVMAGPKRQRAVVNDLEYEWRVAPSPAT
jgi:5-deoxy-D-glucuronate isomerase